MPSNKAGRVELSQTSHLQCRYEDQQITGGDRVVFAEIVNGKFAIKFRVPNGGGYTEVSLTIGDEDICAMMLDLAARRPDLASKFAECTLVAIQNQKPKA